jgi:drug/metabolite transporter (DMT)-like permease
VASLGHNRRRTARHSVLSPQPSVLRVHAALLAVAILFSSNYIISKLGMSAFDPFTFAYLRVLGSAIVLNGFMRYRDAAPLARADVGRVVLYAMLGVVINQTLFLTGLSLTSAHVAAILITIVPVFALGAAIVIGQEWATTSKIAGIVIAFAGALAVVGGEGFAGAMKSLWGDLLIVANSLSYALYLVVSKPAMARLHPRRVIARMFAFSAVLMLPICAWPMLHLHWHTIPPRAWLALALVIAGPTVAAYVLIGWSLAHTDSSLVAAYSYLQPVITIFLAAIFLGERIRPIGVAAGVLIFAGVWLAGRPSPPQATEEAVPGAAD